MKKAIPNALTLGNLLAGWLGFIAVFQQDIKIASLAIIVGAIFDFFDGLAARALKVASPIGKELDSLADVVSFGILPAGILYVMLSASMPGIWPYVAGIYACATALRLAKFNLDTEQSFYFRGLPSPAGALFVAGLPYLQENSLLSGFFGAGWPVLLVTLALAWLLIANISLFSLKFRGKGWKQNRLQIIFVLLACILFVVMGMASLPVIITVYLLTAIFVRP